MKGLDVGKKDVGKKDVGKNCCICSDRKRGQHSCVTSKNGESGHRDAGKQV